MSGFAFLASATAALNNLDDRVVPLIIADILLAPLMATRQGVSNDVEVILRDTVIRFSSLFLIEKIGLFKKLSDAGNRLSTFGAGAQIVSAIAILHTIHMTLLRIIGLRTTTSDDTKADTRRTISERVMGTQLGVPVVPIVDIAIMTGAAFLYPQDGSKKTLNFGLLLYLLALGGRESGFQIINYLRQNGAPIGGAKAAGVVMTIAAVALGGGLLNLVGLSIKRKGTST